MAYSFQHFWECPRVCLPICASYCQTTVRLLVHPHRFLSVSLLAAASALSLLYPGIILEDTIIMSRPLVWLLHTHTHIICSVKEQRGWEGGGGGGGPRLISLQTKCHSRFLTSLPSLSFSLYFSSPLIILFCDCFLMHSTQLSCPPPPLVLFLPLLLSLLLLLLSSTVNYFLFACFLTFFSATRPLNSVGVSWSSHVSRSHPSRTRSLVGSSHWRISASGRWRSPGNLWVLLS